MLRKVVRIDEDKCDGCGLCVPVSDVTIGINGDVLAETVIGG